jgi:hypothetical protein
MKIKENMWRIERSCLARKAGELRYLSPSTMAEAD